jgi:hypothetical protein
MTLVRLSQLGTPVADSITNFPSADGVNALSLAANVAETVTIPTGANIVRIAATADIYIKAGGTATVPGDTTDGTASELIKTSGGAAEWRHLQGVSSLSVITAAAGGGIATFTFYTL